MNVLWIGDSITEGMTPTLKTLLGKLGWAGAIFGKVGWSTVRWLRYGNLNALFNRYHPDLVVLALGTNDENTAEFREAAFALDEGARAVGAKVVWIGSFIDQDINNNLRLWFSGRVADGVVLAEGLPRSADRVHFPVADYPELAQRCVDAVRRLTDRIPWWSKLLMVGAFGGLLYAMVKFEPEKGKSKPSAKHGLGFVPTEDMRNRIWWHGGVDVEGRAESIRGSGKLMCKTPKDRYRKSRDPRRENLCFLKPIAGRVYLSGTVDKAIEHASGLGEDLDVYLVAVDGRTVGDVWPDEDDVMWLLNYNPAFIDALLENEGLSRKDAYRKSTFSRSGFGTAPAKWILSHISDSARRDIFDHLNDHRPGQVSISTSAEPEVAALWKIHPDDFEKLEEAVADSDDTYDFLMACDLVSEFGTRLMGPPCKDLA